MEIQKKICTAHQPAFLPWCGYVHKLLLSDYFVFMDISKFRKRSFMHRNMIEINGMEHFLGLRLSKNSDLLDCNEVILKDSIGTECIAEIVKKIDHTYKKSKYKNDLDDFLNNSFNSLKMYGLNHICYNQLIYLKKKMKINSKIINESEIQTKDEVITLGVSQRLLNHALKTNSKVYLTGVNSKNYLDKDLFHKYGIKHVIQNFDYSFFQKYQKSQKPLSIVHQIAEIGFDKIADLLFNKQLKKSEV
jgi:hypothetical protein